MIRYTLHVPELLNDGTPVQPWQLDQLEADLLTIAGGFTQTTGQGAWRGEDGLYREPVRLYHIDTEPDAWRTKDRLVQLAQDIAERLDQEAVYLTRQEIETFLVTPARKEIEA